MKKVSSILLSLVISSIVISSLLLIPMKVSAWVTTLGSDLILKRTHFWALIFIAGFVVAAALVPSKEDEDQTYPATGVVWLRSLTAGAIFGLAMAIPIVVAAVLRGLVIDLSSPNLWQILLFIPTVSLWSTAGVLIMKSEPDQAPAKSTPLFGSATKDGESPIRLLRTVQKSSANAETKRRALLQLHKMYKSNTLPEQVKKTLLANIDVYTKAAHSDSRTHSDGPGGMHTDVPRFHTDKTCFGEHGDGHHHADSGNRHYDRQSHTDVSVKFPL